MMVLESNVTLRRALDVIDKNGKGIVFFQKNKKINGCLSDGDIRRLILNKVSLDENVESYIKKDFFKFNNSENFSDRDWRVLKEKGIKIVPILNENGELIEFYDLFFDRFVPILEPDLTGNEKKYLIECIDSGWISSKGKFVALFEKKFSELHKDLFSTSTTNGTSALELALLSLDIRQGDEVIVPDITFAASINAVLNVGATPVLCDIKKLSWCIDEKKIEKLISKKTKAIMPVHLYGNSCEMNEIAKIAKDHNLKIIEDCAEAIGTKFNDSPVGTFGDVSTFSFFGNKTITTGEGGMILFKDELTYEKAKLIKNHGMSEKKRYWHEVVGNNYRMTNMQAAIGLAQLERLNEIISKKRHLASLYTEGLMDIEQIVLFPEENEHKFHSNWLYTVIFKEAKERDALKDFLQSINIDTRPMFYPLSDMPLYSKFSHNGLINSKSLSYRGLSLPSSFNLEEEDINKIVTNIKKFFQK